MSNMPSQFETPEIVDGDAELQAKMMAELEHKREEQQAQREADTKMFSFANNERKSNRYEISNPVVCFRVSKAEKSVQAIQSLVSLPISVLTGPS